MLGKNPRLTALESRKRLLVVESELNRLQLQEEWHAMTGGIRSFSSRVKSVGSLASAAALLMAGVSAFRRGKPVDGEAKHSWFQTALKGVRLAGSIWQEFLARSP